MSAKGHLPVRRRGLLPPALGWMRDAGFFLEHLADLPGRSYPYYSRRHKKFKFVPPESRTLADIDFAETRKFAGVAKLRASLDLVRDTAMEILQKQVTFFNAAAPLRKGGSFKNLPVGKRKSCAAISAVLAAEVRSRELTGQSQFSKNGVRANARKVDEAMKVLANPSTWLEAGLETLVPDAQKLDFQQIMTLVLSCIGATRSTVVAAKLVFCCETGWNRQPIDDIPTQVYPVPAHRRSRRRNSEFCQRLQKQSRSFRPGPSGTPTACRRKGDGGRRDLGGG